jgi:hypothetical protein
VLANNNLTKYIHEMTLKKSIVFFFCALSMLTSCSPSSLEDFHYEGQSRCRALIADLQKIHNREQMSRAAPVLKKHFEDLVTLMIHAREFQEEHPDEAAPVILFSESTVSALLEEELRRIYAMEGGREMVERAQHEALVRLDAFERASAKRKEAIYKFF